MTIPAIQYAGKTGEKSIGFGSPETLTDDLNNIANMFNPAATNGGISAENLRPNSVGDVAIGNLAPNDGISTEFTGTGALSVVLSYLAKSIKDIKGSISWLTSPVDTITGLNNKASVNAQAITDLDNNTYKKSQIYTKLEVDNKVFGTNNIANASVTIAKLDPNILTAVGEAQEAAMLIDHDNRINSLENEVIHRTVTVTGTNDYILTCQPPITGYTDLLGIVMTCPSDSTGAVTVNADDNGVINVLKSNGSPVTNFKANGVYSLRFHNGNFILQGEGGEGTAQSSDILQGKTATNDNGLVTGTIPVKTGDNTAVSNSISGTVLKLQVPTGYYGTGVNVTLNDPNRIASNIKKDVTIDGIVGTAPTVPPDLQGTFLANAPSTLLNYGSGSLYNIDCSNDGSIVYVCGDPNSGGKFYLKKYKNGVFTSIIATSAMTGLCCSSSGEILYYSAGGSISRFTESTGTTQSNIISGVSTSKNIACSDDGNILYYVNSSNTGIYKYVYSTSTSTQVSTGVGYTLSCNGDGSILYYCSADNKSIMKFNGTTTTLLTTTNNIYYIKAAKGSSNEVVFILDTNPTWWLSKNSNGNITQLIQCGSDKLAISRDGKYASCASEVAGKLKLSILSNSTSQSTLVESSTTYGVVCIDSNNMRLYGYNSNTSTGFFKSSFQI